MAAGPVSERNQDATIYVGGLDEKVNEALLWELFVQAGPVVNVHMPKDRVTMQHQVQSIQPLQPCGLQLTPCPLHPAHCTLHPAPCTPHLHPTPYTRVSQMYQIASYPTLELGYCVVRCK